MTATEELYKKYSAIIGRFATIEQKANAALDDYNKAVAQKNKEYSTQQEQIKANRKKLLDNAEKNYKLAISSIDRDNKIYDSFERSIPPELKRKAVLKPVDPKQVDVARMNDLQSKILDKSILAVIKRYLGIDGYYSNNAMASEFLSGVAAKKKYYAKVRQHQEQVFRDTNRRNEENYQLSIKRLISSKDADMKTLMDKYERSIANYKAEYKALVADQKVTGMRYEIKARLDLFGQTASNWAHFDSAKTKTNEIMIGTIKLPSKAPASFEKKIEGLLSPFLANGSLYLPFTQEISNKPLNLLINYSSQMDEVISGVQSIVMRVIRAMPVDSYRISVIDPVQLGTNLGILMNLSPTAGCEICQPATSKDGISQLLKSLQNQISDMSIKLATAKNIYNYNNTNKDKIEYNFVVIHDFPAGFDNSSLSSFHALINNSQKCGISLIFTKKSSSVVDQHTQPLIERLNKTFLVINEVNGKFEIDLGGTRFPFAFSESSVISDQYIDDVRAAFLSNTRVDNRFASIYDLNVKRMWKSSTDNIVIPIAVDRYGKPVDIEIGGESTTHTMISGSIGSGKSTTLHTFINGILLNYHPDDVELWLVDYKTTDFAIYCNNTPPGIRFIGLERSEEMTFGLLDKLKEIFEDRMKLFQQNNVKDITEYKKKNGIGSIPRIVVVIDEFHNLTNAIENNDHYRALFEIMLLEYRSLGLSFVLADQAIRDGLRGLTPKGRKQILNRIAMRNSVEEVRETLELDNSFYTDDLKGKISTLVTGEIIFKREIKVQDGQTSIVIDKYRALNTTSSDINASSKFQINRIGNNFKDKDMLIIDSKNRSIFDKEKILEYEILHPPQTQNPLYVGTPSNLERFFRVDLISRRTDENIMLIGSDYEKSMSILLSSIRSYIRSQNSHVIVLADKRDVLYTQFINYWQAIPRERVKVLCELDEICSAIAEIHEGILKLDSISCLIVGIGLDSIFDEMSLLPKREEHNSAKPGNGSTSVSSRLDELIARVDKQRSVPVSSLNDTVDSASTLHSRFDARDEFRVIVEKGSMKGCHSLLSFPSVRSLKKIQRSISPDYFIHKISFRMTADDSLNFFGNSRWAVGLDDDSAVYNDGSTSVKRFRPFLLPVIRSE